MFANECGGLPTVWVLSGPPSRAFAILVRCSLPDGEQGQMAVRAGPLLTAAEAVNAGRKLTPIVG